MSYYTKKYFKNLIKMAQDNNFIEPEYYDKYNVKKGLRNKNGTGVLVGLTKIGDVRGYDVVDEIKVPKDGALYYRGIEIKDFVKGFQEENRMGFEECIFLLLFGKLPSKFELEEFNLLLDELRFLPDGFTENFLLKLPSKNIMNLLQRSVLFLYSMDDSADDLDVENLVRQSLELIAKIPTIMAYGYHATEHYFNGKSLFIHPPKRGLSTAENILYMSRYNSKYTKTEAEVLDLCLVLHAEHGGGNNSAFATHVVSSSGTDTYSAISTAIGSLKGPKHGGANSKVKLMMSNIKDNVVNYEDKTELKNYLIKILSKKAFDREGLIYGMGHAIYTLSDPRAVLLKEKAYELAKEKNNIKEFQLYNDVESLTKEIFENSKGKLMSANVDLYSGFIYDMLNIPDNLYTPIFAAARSAGWSAHRIEQILSDKKIIRPAYQHVLGDNDYTPLNKR
ncbi:citrate/2-methylcitrate synthase [uncultured Ilyobacter sp.]|uniref:citrate/2-methylcitrate synthase n=1 Tax=uncultured Ilyobacter sp. TaxID=544433 RepID=UPI002AA8B742|nr:citrate/2-methylcitrate synthase [uncultured Ilyobacter sp.]